MAVIYKDDRRCFNCRRTYKNTNKYVQSLSTLSLLITDTEEINKTLNKIKTPLQLYPLYSKLLLSQLLSRILKYIKIPTVEYKTITIEGEEESKKGSIFH